ncbi:hypothetical protein JAAARDRAFT_212352 [Jaapia argillacea MUCL 33604]|uniref:Uncharacterized protein n=1 Tax=Jaapia argillacea MUCL 33604 TaxID=933084 RepID=A0A067P239_9AGAM|nr:hypothetical protein JAAARDRAFT_212352 [Jaapia argillacea MUCL 33604]
MPSEPSSAYDAPIRIHSLPLLSASTLPGNNTRPRYRISCYRLVSAVSVVAFGVPKAIAAYQNAQVTATTLDWISGISLSLFIMVAGWWEQDSSSRLKWLFDTDWTPRKPNWDVYRLAVNEVLLEHERIFPDLGFRLWFQIILLASFAVWALCGMSPNLLSKASLLISLSLAREAWMTKLDESNPSFGTVFLWYDRVSYTVIAFLSLSCKALFNLSDTLTSETHRDLVCASLCIS